MENITKHISITNGELRVDNELVFSNKETETPNAFLKSIYKQYEIKYPKYFKMDRLSKLGFIASEMLLSDTNVSDKYEANEVALVLSNSSSTIDVDTKYYKSVTDEEGIASPALFVYTLPNIMIGEICIRNKFRGEIAFLVSKEFNAQQILDYANLVFKNNIKTKACIVGWVELENDTNYNANLFLVETLENTENNCTFSLSNLLKKYIK